MKNSKEDIFISSNTISKKILNDKEESLFSLRIPYSKTMNFTLMMILVPSQKMLFLMMYVRCAVQKYIIKNIYV